MLQFGAEQAVEAFDVVGLEAFAVGRIGNEHAVGRGFFPGAERLELQVDVFGHTRALEVALGDGYGTRRHVCADNGACYFAFGRVIVVEAFKQLPVKVGPLLESKSFAENAGCDVGRNQSAFDQKGA